MSANEHYVGKVVRAVSARCEEKETTPPKHYTEDTLIADMLGAYKFAKNDQDRTVLKETEGLGTSRTREPTITSLVKKAMLISQKKGKLHQITSSDMARATIAALPPMLTDVSMTAKWEIAFKMVERGQVSPEKVNAHLKANLDHLMELAKASKGKINIPIGNSGKNSASSRKSIDVKDTFRTKVTPPRDANLVTAVGKSIKKWF